jgi:hypothetical protein
MVENQLCHIRRKSDHGRGKTRIPFDALSIADLLLQKTTEEKVLEVARTYKSEDGICLLVYASDKAMSYRHDTLSKPLEVSFIAFQNTLHG